MHTNRLAIFILLFFLLAPCPALAKAPLRFSTFHSSVRALIFQEILTTAYNRINVEIRVLPYPGRRGIKYADKGLLDGEAGRLKHVSPLFPNLVMVPVPIFHNQTAAFTKNWEIKIHGWQDLRPYIVTSMLGLKYTENKLKGFPRVHFTPTINEAFEELELFQADITIFALLDGLNIINGMKLKNVTPLVFEEIPSFHFIHKKHTALLPDITASLEQMAAAGELEAIANRYRRGLEKGTHFDLSAHFPE